MVGTLTGLVAPPGGVDPVRVFQPRCFLENKARGGGRAFWTGCLERLQGPYQILAASFLSSASARPVSDTARLLVAASV